MTKDEQRTAPEGDVIWERWQQKRTFVRALEGTYGRLVRELLDQSKVYPSSSWKWKGGPQNFRNVLPRRVRETGRTRASCPDAHEPRAVHPVAPAARRHCGQSPSSAASFGSGVPQSGHTPIISGV